MKQNNINNLTDEQLRRKAIELYQQNWKPIDIISTLGCSKTWFYKWLKRYQLKDETWYQEESRAPKNTRRKLQPAIEQLVIDTRKKLISTRFSQYGPQAIYYDIINQGKQPPPVWEIARILNRHNLARKKQNSSYISKGKKYPYNDLCFSQQMDFIGPRYLKSKLRYYFLNKIDCDTHWSHSSVLTNQASESVCEQLIDFWKITGTPDYLQMDNDLAFWGSLRCPHALGKVIRLCLLLKVTPVFIPLSEPWRNGIIEHFNDTMQKNLLKIEYENIEQLRASAKQIDKIHNQHHRYSSQNGMTPLQASNRFAYPIAPLDQAFKMPKTKLPLEEGEIHIIRFIRSDLKFNIFGLSFPMPENVKYEYIKGIILTHENCLMIYNDYEYITTFAFYLMP